MPLFTDVPVSDPRATALLTEYFGDRDLSFPVEQGKYRPTFPTPEQFVPPAGVFVLLIDADDAIGCGGIRRLGDTPDGTLRYEVKHLWLQPRTRGRGWGRLLLTELERRAAGFGATEVVLDTNASLESAAALYQRSGYVGIAPYNDNPNATNWYRKTLPLT
ncbi:GNAT family N-acetyltransferase [Cryobacterium psychrophilum]|uniref:GNAT family N-acetyltransferase n=1 Tax=Cryobacterium psychrophilum TaxID=41988 RepID=A0A4Y8KNH7_9MICO|nr:GNAT family N-acetyltransferase [Cryobacterium psychrophilum]TDW29033.1 acetyltransferase (GNAT) family protein [Cryobacterium psychrophilum]TFD79751.1 GNAT family N-acetyltransferase [Cryobacterium psychrophilum]